MCANSTNGWPPLVDAKEAIDVLPGVTMRVLQRAADRDPALVPLRRIGRKFFLPAAWLAWMTVWTPPADGKRPDLSALAGTAAHDRTAAA